MGWIRRPTIGLALGGGGARGLAHIGVLKVLCEENIPIDYIAGTSMGGIIGGLFSAGIDPAKMEAEAVQSASQYQLIRFVDIAPPRRGLLNSDKIRAYLHNLLAGDPCIEDLPRPFCTVAVDLHGGEEVHLQRGSLLQAMIATASVPGIFPAVEDGKRSLVDGGVLNNVPVDVVRQMGAEYIIAVDVSMDEPVEALEQYAEYVPQFARLMPRFAIDFYRAEMLMIAKITETRLKHSRPNLLIDPHLPPYISVFFGFPYATEAIESGVKAARGAIDEIKNKIKPSLRTPRDL